MIYVAGSSVIHPSKKLMKFINKQYPIKGIIKDILKFHSRLDTVAVTGKLVGHYVSWLPSKLPINSIFWPVGSMRFGVGVFLVSEEVADIVFAKSLGASRKTLCYDNVTSGVLLDGCLMSLERWMERQHNDEMNWSEEEEGEGREEEEEEEEEGTIGDNNPLFTSWRDYNRIIASGAKAANLMPVQVIATQRHIMYEPFRYQSYFVTWMIPIAYIPLTHSHTIVDRKRYVSTREIDGVGLLVLVDQRYIWNFVYVPNEFLAVSHGEGNPHYFAWDRVLSTLAMYLLPQQYRYEYLEPYGRQFFHDVVGSVRRTVTFSDPRFKNYKSESDLSIKPPSSVLPDSSGFVTEITSQDVYNTSFSGILDNEDEGDTNILEMDFDDDRAFYGPPIDMLSEGNYLTLAQAFALIEQSLFKRLLFHPNWQVELINPVSARLRFVRNLLFFAPRFAFYNQDLYQEIGVTGVTKDKALAHEFPLVSGGFVQNRSEHVVEVNKQGKLVSARSLVMEAPNPLKTVTLPHFIEVVGNLFILNRFKPDTPSNDQETANNPQIGQFFPFSYTFYRCCLVPKDQAVIKDIENVDFLQDVITFYYDENGNKVYMPFLANVFLPGNLFGMYKTAVVDSTTHRIITTHLTMSLDYNVYLEEYGPGAEPIITKSYSDIVLNRVPGWNLGRAVVRNFLGWLLFPFTWHFKNMNYWPLTGFEDYIVFRNNGSVYVKGMQYDFLSQRSGVRYIGHESPMWVAVETPHKLLSSSYHADTSDADYGAFVVNYNTNTYMLQRKFYIGGQPVPVLLPLWSPA